MGEPEPPKPVDQRRVAIHEAGHAVIGTVHGLELVWARVTAGTSHEFVTEAGRCEWRGGTDALGLKIAASPTAVGAMCFAGSLAEERLLGWSESDAEAQDFDLWRKAIGWMEASDPAPAHRLEQLRAAFEQSERDVETHEEAIRTVSASLLAAPDLRLDGDAVRDLIGAG